jgi:hypothetical protein
MAGTVLLATAFFAGCAGSVSYRTYDPHYRDYHVWNDGEAPYFNTWIVETHHPRVEYRRLRKPDREAYWRWRHDHK